MLSEETSRALYSVQNQRSQPTIDQLRDWDRNHVWHAFTQMAEYDGLIIESGQGCWLQDVQGRRFLDGVSSLWCNIHGHNHPVINSAIEQQLQRVAHVTLLGMSHPTTIRLAKRLCDMAPNGLEHVFFSSDGSSAVEVALKMAFQFWRQCDHPQPERTLFLSVGGAYHGDTIGSVSLGGMSRFHAMFDPLLFPVIHGPCPDTYRLPMGITQEHACEFYLTQYRSIFEQHRGKVAAIILEPIVQGAAGMVMHPAGFLAGIRRLATEFDVLLIADEVAVGMGRLGTMFACEQEDIAPDFLCLGKGLTGGYLPMAVTLTTDRVWHAFLGEYRDSRSFFHGHTYGGNPLAAAAAHATLDLFEMEQTLDHLPRKVRELSEFLQPLIDHPHVGDFRQRGLIAAIELVQDKRHQVPYPWSESRGIRVCQKALEYGVWLRPLGNVIVIIPPLSIQSDELRLIAQAVHAGVHASTMK